MSRKNLVLEILSHEMTLLNDPGSIFPISNGYNDSSSSNVVVTCLSGGMMTRSLLVLVRTLLVLVFNSVTNIFE